MRARDEHGDELHGDFVWRPPARAEAFENEWTEKTPPPPLPPGADSEPDIDVPRLGSLSSLPSLGALSAGPVNAGPRLPGLPPTDASASPSPGAAASTPSMSPLGSSNAALAAASSSAHSLPYAPPAEPAHVARGPYAAIEPPRVQPAMTAHPPYAPAPAPESWPAWTPPPPAGALDLVKRWWPVALGAIAIAILAFVVTQALITPDVSPVRAPIDAAPPPERATGTVPPAPAPVAPAADLDGGTSPTVP